MSDYEGWYERIRESEAVSTDELTSMSAEQVLKEFGAKGDITSAQRKAIRQQQVTEDVDTVNEENTVETSRAVDIEEDSAYRPDKFDETMVSTSKGDISSERIEGSYELNGKTYIRVDGKVYGTLEE